MTCASTGRPATSRSGFGTSVVCGYARVPLPPHRITVTRLFMAPAWYRPHREGSAVRAGFSRLFRLRAAHAPRATLYHMAPRRIVLRPIAPAADPMSIDHLIEPHGGRLVDLLVSSDRAAELKDASRDWQSWDLTARQLCDL